MPESSNLGAATLPTAVWVIPGTWYWVYIPIEASHLNGRTNYYNGLKPVSNGRNRQNLDTGNQVQSNETR